MTYSIVVLSIHTYSMLKFSHRTDEKQREDTRIESTSVLTVNLLCVNAPLNEYE